MATLLKCTVTLPPAHSDSDLAKLLASLAQHVTHGWEEETLPTGEALFIVHYTHPRFCDALSAALSTTLPGLQISRETVEEENWLESWKTFFTPVEGGSHFLVLAPWMTEECAATSRIPIIIEPKAAFGTGHHATTVLCLDAVSMLATEGKLQKGMRFLDIGAGSGILAIACAKLGLTGDALDIDSIAVESALENRDKNNVPSADISAIQGSVEEATGLYDIVLANILAAPLKEMAPQIASLRSGRPGGHPLLVLCGILESQADDVEKAYADNGFVSARRLCKNEWTALIFG
jgi:ribosomal protein L11 methyltransferase